jgi:hypothetical protein
LRPRAYHAPRRFAPSTVSLVSFQPGALTGFYPSELDLTVIVFASRRRLPLLRLAMPETRALNTVAGARGLSSRCDLASGVFPLSVGDAAQEFIRSSTPWLSWVLPPWGIPLPRLRPRRSCASSCEHHTDPTVPSRSPKAACWSSAFGLTRALLGKNPYGPCSCASSFKEPGRWLASFETADP